MKRRTFLATVAGVSAGALAGCVGTSTPVGDYDVGMGHSSFRPPEFTVDVGETVVWGNSGSRSHSVTAFEDGIPEAADYFASGGFDSQQAAVEGWPYRGMVESGETYEHTFEVPGTYNYYCIPHLRAGMVGKILVRE